MSPTSSDKNDFKAWNNFDVMENAAKFPTMQSHNFEFLRKDYPELANLGGFTESYSFSDPVSGFVKLRTYGESLVKAIFAHHKFELTFQSSFNELLHDSSFRYITPRVIQDKLHLLRIKGNKAAHGELPKEDEEDAADYFSLISLLHRRLDKCVATTPRNI